MDDGDVEMNYEDMMEIDQEVFTNEKELITIVDKGKVTEMTVGDCRELRERRLKRIRNATTSSRKVRSHTFLDSPHI